MSNGASRSDVVSSLPVDLAPSFVACCARSGSTLLRFLLDAHPSIACPGETDLAVVLAGYLRVASDIERVAPGTSTVAERTRALADELMAPLLVASDKTRWCDKSLSNVFHLELLSSLWPESRFLLLHRSCMDFVMNGLEVSPWGLSQYGFNQVAQMSPTDSVVALCAYWVDRTSRLLAFEAQHQDRCLRLRYEDLVRAPDDVMKDAFSFLGVEPIENATERAFSAEHSTVGAADHEIWYTDGVQTDSVGEGARVPPDHVTGPLRQNVNDLLARLGYEGIDDNWGRGAARPFEFDGQQSAPAEIRVVRGHDVVLRVGLDLASGLTIPHVEGHTPAPFVIAIEDSALEKVAAGANLGSAIRSRVVRPYGLLPSFFRDEREVFAAVGRFLSSRPSELFPRS